ncbi:MAG: hypothetical protein LBT89_08940, partial [Planctomycetaceae bacterium]|nr:hypothetical protein [Planctomycetaceae bacterium]
GVIRRHNAFYRLLHELLLVEAEDAGRLACEMEHTLSPDIADKFIDLVEKALERNQKQTPQWN